MHWSQYQLDIFDEAARVTTDNVAVVARAGSGKTSTLIQSLSHLPNRNVLLCAFNKAIQTEMERRAPSHVMTRTLHSVGLRVHQETLALQGKPSAKFVVDKAKEHAYAILREKSRYIALTRPIGSKRSSDSSIRLCDAVHRVRKLASYGKNVLAAGVEELFRIVGQLDLDDDGYDARLLAEAAHELMERSAEDRAHVDFDDMVWFPARFGYGTEPRTMMLSFGTVMVDECQDLNAAQHWMVKQMHRNGRVIGFLDDRQTLYAFRGADRDAIGHIIGDDTAKRLPLSISYRCPLAVIEKARLVVDDIEAAPHARPGTIRVDTYADMLAEAQPGDFVLSRTNAPLMAACCDFLRRNKPATVAGRDIGQSLVNLLQKSQALTLIELERWLSGWLGEQHERYGTDNPERFERALDRANALRAIAAHCDSVFAIRVKIELLFSDDTSHNKIVCSTVHKAKGLETDRVWLLHDTFGYPEPKPWQDRWSEENIWYVAVTRSRDTLSFVETEVDRMLGRRPRPRVS